MPIVWRYVLKSYFKIFTLCLLTLVGISFLIKHRQLTLLIVSGATPAQAIVLSLCMLVLTLPHIFGIVSFVSSFLTVYKLNSSGELSALRSSGLGFTKIFTPLYFIGGVLMLFSFFLVSQGLPYTKLLVNRIYTESQTINPLVLLRKNKFPVTRNLYTEMNLNHTGSISNNVLIAYFLEKDQHLALFLADSLEYIDQTLIGKENSLISYFPTKEGTFDHLGIDNQAYISSPESLFASLLDRSSKLSTITVAPLDALIHNPHRKAKPELFQRFSYMLYPLTFTFLGICGPIHSKDRLSKRDLLFLSLMIFFYFTAFFIIRKPRVPSNSLIFFALAPHFCIPFLSLLRQRRLS